MPITAILDAKRALEPSDLPMAPVPAGEEHRCLEADALGAGARRLRGGDLPCSSRDDLVTRVMAADVSRPVSLADWLEAWALATVLSGAVASVAIDCGTVLIDGPTLRMALALVERSVEAVTSACSSGQFDVTIAVDDVDGQLGFVITVRGYSPRAWTAPQDEAIVQAIGGIDVRWEHRAAAVRAEFAVPRQATPSRRGRSPARLHPTQAGRPPRASARRAGS